jgi:hypothetical protein
VRFLAAGKYKHVRIFAHVPECDAWVFFDPGWGQWSLFVARGKSATLNMRLWCEDSDVLKMPANLASSLFHPRAFLCTSAVRRLIGVPGGALRPDALYRDCLRYGAKIVDAEARHAAGSAGRSLAGFADGGGAARPRSSATE